jgi:MT0933-like antitoxin protein
MGIADSFKEKADQVAEKVGPERTKEGIQKAGDKADEMTGGKYKSHVDKGQQAASDYIDKKDRGGSNE